MAGNGDAQGMNDQRDEPGAHIAQQRGFDSCKMTNADAALGQQGSSFSSHCLTIPCGISPSALLDSPIMFPKEQEDTEDSQETGTKDGYTVHEKSAAASSIDDTQVTNHKTASYLARGAAKYSEDGFYWRKYGQKHVKGSEHPRSYYKCTNMNCPVRKKVERSRDGQITEIEYKGFHNHPKPQISNSSDLITDTNGLCFTTPVPKPDALGQDHGTTNSDPFLGDSSSMSVDTREGFLCPPNHQSDNQNEASQESVSLGHDNEDSGEYESKKRKTGGSPDEAILPTSTREPRVVVQIESEIDILDDGYRWRKYGQKVVKGNPNPRSYYKCTTPGCLVRKHIERAANDIKSVVTTYEGKHNHLLPSHKNGTTSDVTTSPANPSPCPPRLDDSKARRRVPDMTLYTQMIDYSELMRPNFLSSSDMNINLAASVYSPLTFPPLNHTNYGPAFVGMNGIFPALPGNPMNHSSSSSRQNYGMQAQSNGFLAKPKDEQMDPDYQKHE